LVKSRLLAIATPLVIAAAYSGTPASASSGPGVGNIPQGVQSNDAYAQSFNQKGVSNVFATAQQVSCYTPEAIYSMSINDGPNDGYDGQTPCNGAATTHENLGPYANQQGSAPGYPAPSAMLVKDHSESDIRVDPTNPKHIIASSKWFEGAESYDHVLGFYESFDGGKTWPVQGHIPGYEGFTDNTDPVGAFDGYGNYYEFILPYQFAFTSTGSHLFQKSNLPDPANPPEATSVAVRPHGSKGPNDWITTHTSVASGVKVTTPDYVYQDYPQGQEPDKQWIAIDTHKLLANGQANPNYNNIYVMFVNFSFSGSVSKPYVSIAKALPDGTHTDWSPLRRLPSLSSTSSDTYLLPHVDPNGVVWTSVANFPSRQSKSTATLYVDWSTDGGKTWQGPSTPAASNVTLAPFMYHNTTFRDGIEETFAVGTHQTESGQYPLYMAWEDDSLTFVNIILSASYDGGTTWSKPIQVNDNANAQVDEFQPQLAVAPDGTVSVNFYDRRLNCADARTAEAAGAGLALDQQNPNYTGALPPYGASNYCVNASVQFYSPTLAPYGHNIRISQHTADFQLNAPHDSSPTGTETFAGDYFGNDIARSTDYSTFVSTFNDGTNPQFRQQQVVAEVAVP
jgi:hypothetical protein